MPAAVINGEAGSSVRDKINDGFVAAGTITPNTGDLDFSTGFIEPEAIGTTVQGFHVNLSALSGLTGLADRLAYFTGAGAMALATFTAFGRSLVAAVDAAAARTLLGAAPTVAPTFTGVAKFAAAKGTAATIGAGYVFAAADVGTVKDATAAGTATVPAASTLCPVAGDSFSCVVRNVSGGNYVLDRPGGTNVTMAAGEVATITARNGGSIIVVKGAGTVIS